MLLFYLSQLESRAGTGFSWRQRCDWKQAGMFPLTHHRLLRAVRLAGRDWGLFLQVVSCPLSGEKTQNARGDNEGKGGIKLSFPTLAAH